jgi:hypothetical protein
MRTAISRTMEANRRVIKYATWSPPFSREKNVGFAPVADGGETAAELDIAN